MAMRASHLTKLRTPRAAIRFVILSPCSDVAAARHTGCGIGEPGSLRYSTIAEVAILSTLIRRSSHRSASRTQPFP